MQIPSLINVKLWVLFFPFIMLTSVYAQKTCVVEADYTYYAPFTMSPAEAQIHAVALAKNKALFEKFGSIVSSNRLMMQASTNGRETDVFSALDECETKGEWLKDIEMDVVERMFTKDGFNLSVHVKGEAREIVSTPIKLDVKVLCGGTGDASERKEFNEGEDFHMSFCSPVNGFLAIFFIDDDGNAFRLLPFANSNGNPYSIKHDQKYTFFTREDGNEVKTTCTRPIEFNHIYTIFSPHKFQKPVDLGVAEIKDEGLILPPQLSLKDFQKWLLGLRKYDKDLTVDRRTIKINKLNTIDL